MDILGLLLLFIPFKLMHRNSWCRLMDCIKILEDMERHGSLNMDKVNWEISAYIYFIFYL